MRVGYVSAKRAADVGSFVRYLTKDGRYLLAGGLQSETIALETDAIHAALRDYFGERPLFTTYVDCAVHPQLDAFAATTIIRDALRRVDGLQHAIVVAHGPPAESGHLHVHVLGVLPRLANGHILQVSNVRRRLVSAVAVCAKEAGLESVRNEPHFASREYFQSERDDRPSFREFTVAQGLAGRLSAAASWTAFHDVLSTVSAGYGFDERGGFIDDRSQSDGTAIKVSRLGPSFSHAKLVARLGPYEDSSPVRMSAPMASYAQAQTEPKFERAIVVEHTAARRTWERDVAPRLARAQAAARAEDEPEVRAVRALAKAVRRLRVRADRPGIESDVAGVRREILDALARGTKDARARQADAIALHYPPRPARRISDWLKQGERRETPLATLGPVAITHPLAVGESTVDGGREVYVDGLRIGAEIDGTVSLFVRPPIDAFRGLRATAERVTCAGDPGLVGDALRILAPARHDLAAMPAPPTLAPDTTTVLTHPAELVAHEIDRLSPGSAHIDETPYDDASDPPEGARAGTDDDTIVMVAGTPAAVGNFTSTYPPAVAADTYAIFEAVDAIDAAVLRDLAREAGLQPVDVLASAESPSRFPAEPYRAPEGIRLERTAAQPQPTPAMTTRPTLRAERRRIRRR